jgi:hypothetical protein
MEKAIDVLLSRPLSDLAILLAAGTLRLLVSVGNGIQGQRRSLR